MRKIRYERHRHNDGCVFRGPGRFALLVLLAAATAIQLSGCSGDDSRSDADTSTRRTAAGSASDTCRVEIDADGWNSFRDLGDRITAHEPVSREDLAAWGDRPAVAEWRRALPVPRPSALRVANWLEATFRSELGLTGREKVNSARTKVARNYRFSYDNRVSVDSALAAFTADGYDCRLRDLAERWISPDRLPEPLVLRMLPGPAELRIDNGVLLADTGMFLAAGNAQFVRHAVALIYRRYETLPGKSPLTASGADSMFESLRTILNEGIANWIEGATILEFRKDHPSLGGVHMIPEEFFYKAQDTVRMLAARLPDMLGDPEVMAEEGPRLGDTLTASNGFVGMGYAMSAVISAYLGEDRLREVRGSVPAFFAAYQEAALRNATPAPRPGTAGVELHETVPPLPPEVFQALHERLVAHYGGPAGP